MGVPSSAWKSPGATEVGVRNCDARLAWGVPDVPFSSMPSDSVVSVVATSTNGCGTVRWKGISAAPLAQEVGTLQRISAGVMGKLAKGVELAVEEVYVALANTWIVESCAPEGAFAVGQAGE